jgi:hypothetical protein
MYPITPRYVFAALQYMRFRRLEFQLTQKFDFQMLIGAPCEQRPRGVPWRSPAASGRLVYVFQRDRLFVYGGASVSSPTGPPP